MSRPLAAAFDVELAVLSDWHVGTGQGRPGAVDATVRRDADGLPFVPAKTLTGVWRDACEQVAGWWCGPPEQNGPWWAWVDWLFGSQPPGKGDRVWARHGAPQSAALRIGPARLPEQLRAATRTRPALAAAAVVLRPGVAIDDDTGTATDGMLRVEERARPSVLRARVELDVDALAVDDPAAATDALMPVAAELLLRAGAAAIEGIGGKRNRGAGRSWLLLPGSDGITIDVTAAQAAAALPVPATPRPVDSRLVELFDQPALLDEPGVPPVRQQSSASALRLDLTSDATDDPRGSGDKHRVTRRVVVEVISPVVAQHRVVGNVILSRDHVPGTALLPAVLSRLSRTVGHRDVVVTDARPAVEDGHGGYRFGQPAPMVWYRPKERHRRDIVNAAEGRPTPQQRCKAMRSGHVAGVGDGRWELVNPSLVASTHAVVDDDAGRPTVEGGNVFSYLALAPGTLLWWDVVTPDDVTLDLAPGVQLRIGRSRKDDFGQVVVRSVDTLDAEAHAPGRGLAAGAETRVWCRSDLLVRNEFGAADTSPTGLARALAQQWAVPVVAVEPSTDGPVLSAHRAARRDSFHTRWGRPRPSLVGLAAGSVVTVRVGGVVPAETVARTERDGIGERTAEGFGRVSIDAAEARTASPELTRHAPIVPAVEQAPAVEQQIAVTPDPIERAAVLAEVRRQVADLLAADPGRAVAGWQSVTSRAQWGSLLEHVPRLRTDTGRAEVARWVAQTRAIATRSRAWGTPALDDLERLLTPGERVWALLGLDEATFDGLVLDRVRVHGVRTALWPDATGVLVTELCRVAIKRLQSSPSTEAAR